MLIRLTCAPQTSIRNFIAFPKNNMGRDVMIDSPSTITAAQLGELNIGVTCEPPPPPSAAAAAAEEKPKMSKAEKKAAAAAAKAAAPPPAAAAAAEPTAVDVAALVVAKEAAASPLYSAAAPGDFAAAKHVPSVAVADGKVTVTVAHGMAPEHFIEFIWAKDQAGAVVAAVQLTAADAPALTFDLPAGCTSVTAFESCNLHGVWTSEPVPAA